MRLVWVLIVLVFASIIGVQESFSQNSEPVEDSITWDRGNYRMINGTEAAKIIVTDHDKNQNSFFVETVNVFVYSDSFAEGITLELYETGKNSGVFERTFTLSESRSAPSILYVRNGDTAIAIYSDYPLPSDYLYKTIDLTATVLIGSTGPPLERAPVSNARITDIHRNAINYPIVDEQILLTSDIANQQIRNQTFVWIAQVTSGDDKTEALSWINGTLNAESSFSPATSWIPKKEGEYRVVFFVWESITNPTALSPPIALEFTVLEKPPENKIHKEITISIGDPVNKKGLLPITTTETTENIQNLGSVTDWHFLPLNHGEWGPSGGRLSWDILPSNDRFFDISGIKDGKQIEFETSFFRDDAMRNYPANCQGIKIDVLSAVPTDMEIPENMSSVSVTLSEAGLLPVDGLYTLQFASFFRQNIMLPENAIITYADNKRCSVDYGDYSVAFYDVVVFKLQNHPEDFDFKYSFGVGEKNSYDSNNSLYVTDMVCDDPVLTHVELTDTEKTMIWESISENNFFQMDDFTENCDASGNCIAIVPETRTTLFVTGGGIKHTVSFRDSFIGKNGEEFSRFKNIVEIIDEIFEDKEELKFRPDPRCGYM